MTKPTLTIEPAGTAFELVVRQDGETFRYPALTRSVAEVMLAQEERRLGIRPPHMTLADLKTKEAPQA